MQRTVLMILCVAVWATTAAAQNTTVSGVVLDARTRRGLPDVLVSVDGADATVRTDADGRFEVTLAPGDHLFTASLVGYVLARQPVRVSALENAPLTIALAEGAGVLEERITVSASSRPGRDDAPAAMSLHGRELQALRGVTLDDPLRALHSTPSAAATDDFYAEFAVRGSPFRQVGLVVDGIPSNYLMHAVHGVTDGGSIAMVNSDALSSLTLMPGSYPQRVGRRLGAQVQIDLREGDRERFRARAGLSGTSATTVLEGPLANGRGSWLVSARRSYLDLLLKRIDDGDSFAFGFTDGQAKVVFDVTPRHQLEVLAVAGRSRFEEEPENLGINDEAEVVGRTWLSAATWRFTPSGGFAVTHRVYATGLAYRNTNRDNGILDDALSAEAGWRMDAAASLRPSVLLEFGADAERLWRRHDRRRAPDDALVLLSTADYRTMESAFSGYVQTVLGGSARVNVTPGIRLDRWGPTRAVTTSPWVTSTVRVAAGTRVHMGGGLYRQFATLDQIHGPRGTSDLRPETARHFDVAVSQQLPLDLTLQIASYARDERDVLWTPDSEPRRMEDGSIALGRGDARWTNRLDGRASGVEAVLRRDAPSGLTGWVGYAFGRHRYTDRVTHDAFWADFDQRHALSLFGHYRLSTRTSISAKFRYGSNYPLTGYIGAQPAFANAPPLFGGSRPLFYGLVDQRNTLRLPAYARLDIRADRSFMWANRRLTLFAELANALNRQNVRNVPYDVDRIGRVLEPTATLLPIVPSAGFVIDF